MMSWLTPHVSAAAHFHPGIVQREVLLLVPIFSLVSISFD